jgi:hypothetical protein
LRKLYWRKCRRTDSQRCQPAEVRSSSTARSTGSRSAAQRDLSRGLAAREILARLRDRLRPLEVNALGLACALCLLRHPAGEPVARAAHRQAVELAVHVDGGQDLDTTRASIFTVESAFTIAAPSRSLEASAHAARVRLTCPIFCKGRSAAASQRTSHWGVVSA